MHIGKSVSANWNKHSDEPVMSRKMGEFFDQMRKNLLVWEGSWLHGIGIEKIICTLHTLGDH